MRNIDQISYSIKGFDSLICTANAIGVGHPTVAITYTVRRTNALDQRVWDGVCLCGATCARMEYRKNVKRKRR